MIFHAINQHLLNSSLGEGNPVGFELTNELFGK